MLRVENIKFIIAENNYLIRKGLKSVIEKHQRTEVVKEIDNNRNIIKIITKYKADVLFINPQLLPEKRNNIASFFSQRSKLSIVPIFYAEKDLYPPHSIHTSLICNSEADVIKNIIDKITSDFLSIQPTKKESTELTKREKSVLTLIATGLTNKQIGEKLFISEHTAIVHRKHITKKLDIKSVSGLTVYAVLNKLIDIKAM